MRRFALLAAASMLLFFSSVARADASDKGRSLLETRCAGCHSLDGSPRIGPSFAGAWGQPRKVTTDGVERTVTFDEAYLARSLREPDADVAVGFPKGNMPKLALGDADVASIGRAIAALNEPPSTRTKDGLLWLALACLAFVGLHVVLSSIPVRTRLVAKVGKGFAPLYAVVIGITFVGIVFAFRASAFVEVWAPPRWTRWAPILVMPIVFWLIGAGNAARGPTAAGGKMPADAKPHGILAITRHPALVGFSLWAITHLLANGELRAVLVFVAILALAIIGMFHIDHRRAVDHGEPWRAYAAQTSRFPFAAVASGRAKLAVGDFKIAPVIIAIILYAGVLHLHAWVIGVSPFP